MSRSSFRTGEDHQLMTFSRASVLAAATAILCSMLVEGWCPLPTDRPSRVNIVDRLSFIGRGIISKTSTVSSSLWATTDDVSGMRLSEIKAELRERRIDFSDCFDKESMVAKLAEARASNIDNSDPPPASGGSSSSSSSDDSSSETREEVAPETTFDREAALEELKGMRVRELREELGRRRIPRAGLFEKEDIVNALLEARAIASVYSGTGMLTPGEVSDLSEADVSTEIDHPGTLLLLDVYATWCGPCQMIAPILKEIAAEEGDKLRVIKMDSDKNQGLASKLKVNGLPTLVLFQGGNEIDRLEGAPSKEQLVGWIDSRR